MCGVRYEGLPGRLWACYSCQLMSDTLLTDLSIHIHHNTLGQDILRCTNLGSLTEKRPRKVGYMLFVAGNSSVTPCVCIVYIVCSLCTFFSLVSAMFSFLSYMDRRWEGGVDGTLQSQQALDAGSFSRSTSVRLRCRAVWRPDTVQPLYVSVQCRIFTRYPRRCEQICMSDHVCTHHLPRLCGASHIDAFWIVRLLSLALQLWLLLTLPSPPCLSAFPTSSERTFRMGGRYPWGRSYVLLHRRSFSSIHRYHTKNRHATIPGRSRNGYECTGTPYKRLRRKL